MMRLIDEQSELLEFSARARGIDEHYATGPDHAARRPASRRRSTCRPSRTRVRDRYGRTTYGQGCLLARRLVEAGVRFVNVYFATIIGGCEGGWDTHGFNDKPMYPILKKYLLPHHRPDAADAAGRPGRAAACSTTTLVVWVGEFGRSPQINNMAGRDHWPQCYTALLAGGGVKRGHVYGASRQDRRLPGQRPGAAGGPVGDDVPPARHRPQDAKSATP